ncbi:response regulator [Paragemmobacter straminiformis]|uniref:histidine kinase n=1 Tax=Paragemmobacter straminiformis TaxID=2045119 RepID=A0A842I5G5_9RHOB|nr:response regulator [Gemmobacter straminiformis]MBC2834845.1 response regulator [Gemmobacter straminiformis]
MPYQDPQTAPAAGKPETGEAYVFRDFERSRILAIRRALADDPALYTFWFLAVVAIWTVLMSAAAGLHGQNLLAVNVTPHVAQYTLILGIFFYPRRLAWVPLLAYGSVFLYPFYQPFTNSTPWNDIHGLTWTVVAMLFAISLGAGLVLSWCYDLSFRAARLRMRAHSADLFLCFASFVFFAVIGAIQISLSLRYAATLDPALRAALGFGPDYVELSVIRMLRGCVVVAAFLLAALEFPRRNQILPTFAVMLLFPLMAAVQARGYVLYPMIDVVVLGMVLVIALPLRVALFGCIGGFAIYAALTGAFLRDMLPADPHEVLLERYSLMALTMLLLGMAVKSHTDNLISQKDAAIRKLDRARDFAGVGLFALNRATGRFRLDDAAQRMLSLPAEGPIDDLRDALSVDDAAALMRGMMPGAAPSRDLVMHATTGRVLHSFLWTEPSPAGDPVSFGILLDVTESENRETRLKETLEELSNRQERQRQLFSIVSHELRTPASVMSILIDDLPDTDDRTRLHRQMREAADQLLSVLGDMRQTVNPEKNLPVKRVSYVPAELAESLRNALSLTARDHDISLSLSLGAGAAKPRVGDVMRLRQALSNLMRNALIHSKGTQVRLSFSAQPPMVAGAPPVSQWQVEDDGIGIAADQVDRLFLPFERGTDDPRRLPDGSGLGLYIARQSIEMLGGTLQFYQPQRGGAGYVLRLPEPLAEAAQEPSATAPATAPLAPDHVWSVVLAEDNALVADVTKARLERLHAKVRVAPDGRAALEMIAERQPDLVITDLFMPELDGDDLIRRLRQQGYTRPIIGLTAAVVGEEMNRFHAAGANIVMQKPLDFAEVLRMMREGFPDAPTF